MEMDILPSAEFKKMVVADVAKWAAVIKAASVKAE